ncbi:MAG: hypothetical protein ACOCWO_03910, partial [Candidatus Muiribacteriaceae bacterium]
MKKIFIGIIVLVMAGNIFGDKILEVNGNVQISPKNEKNWKSAEAGIAVHRGNAVRTLQNSRAALKLFEGSIVRLEPESLIIRRSKNQYEVNGMVALVAKNQKKPVRFIQGNNYLEFEEGSFLISANANMLWGISNDFEFWAKGPDGRLRVLGGYQTVITRSKGPVEPEQSHESRYELFQKAKLTEKYDAKPEKMADKKRQLFEKQSFFMKISRMRICSHDVEEKALLYLNRDDLIRNEVLIQGEVEKTQADDIRAVMISLDGGETYQEAEGVSPFRFSFTPQHKRKYLLRIMAKDKRGSVSGRTFHNIEIHYIDDTDEEQIERYIDDLVNFIRDEQYNGVMVYFDDREFYGDFQAISDNTIDFFYYYDYFYLRYDIRNFIKFGKNAEVGI